ncbi:RagB/SusD family nutrient uptake outer membrane protein [Aestuariibaculum sediminum]|uniref:RagB/SusD family nutrient uptake outer membrane protein n=1 Tax=Aestuariibaculum sediminum TaxID=2770637 RepID=A0A8J6QC67_9FLAO|nr:RagB/SusD family nutrient uptake outer membrane protein [Aestuariibaculum sediminum]MBD0833376.1 RagB/SusD family nutrient uptake outer membrane protein [Aestuariibaculum sediminum]
MSSCDSYTDFTPKGRKIVQTQSDLELLANKQYSGFDFTMLSILINDHYPQSRDIPFILTGNSKDLTYTQLTYDESIDREQLDQSGELYSRLYAIINGTANPLISFSNQVSGNQNELNSLKAEGYVIRAFLHYYLVNIYAKAYDPSTAAEDGGIPYVKDLDLDEINPKLSVQEVYDNIMADIDSAIELDALPETPINAMRVGKGFAYAVKAKILMSLGDYESALDAVNVALTYNNVLEDHRPLLSSYSSNPLSFSNLRPNGLIADDNLFYSYYARNWPFSVSPSYEIVNEFYEAGNILKDSLGTQVYEEGNAVNLPGIPEWSGGYQQNNAGITTSDLYLIKAECLIRTDEVEEGMNWINEIRLRRVSPYAPLQAANASEAMGYLQKTARIEYLYSGKSYFDIKRWNKEGEYPITISRTLEGVTYTLSPNSSLWIYPFPLEAGQLNPTLGKNY